ncbi:MAG TPA: hypothetical protein VMV92_25250 [Streptosporangiaceae bacterium]|nr:hypothetical protein [Streptosporangiaceae bacterium]
MPPCGIGSSATTLPRSTWTAIGEAGIHALRAKGILLTSYLIDLADAWLAPLGCVLASPRDSARRGSHVCLRHPEAWRISQALIQAGVIGDYRTPGRLRLGPAPQHPVHRRLGRHGRHAPDHRGQGVRGLPG